MNNLVVQLLLRTGTFSTDLKQARGQVQNFQKGCQTAGKSVTAFGNALGLNVGALTKLGGAVGIAVAAGKELKAILDSNQTSADAFQGVMAGCTGVIQTFNQAMATSDFSYFRDGLWSVFEAAKAAREAIDDLNDASLAYGYLSKKNQTAFQEAYNTYKDPQSTQAMKDAAKAQMQEAVDAQFEYARTYGKKQMDAYVTQVVKEAGSANIEAMNITNAQFQKAMEIKLGMAGDTAQIEKQYDQEYKAYQAKMKEYGKNNTPAQKELQRRYADVIAIRAMVKGMNDDELTNVVNIISGMEDAKMNALSMEKTMNRAIKGEFSTTTGVKKELKVQEQSLEYWNKMAQNAKKYRDVEVFNSESWNSWNDVMNMALEKIKEINDQTEILSRKNVGSISAIKSDTSLNNMVVFPYTDTKKTVNEIEWLINELTAMRNELKEGDPQIAKYNQRIEELGKRLEGIRTVGVAVPKVDKSVMSTWDSFNQVMANTSIIVSSLANTFKEGTELTAASVLQMVSTALPAIGSLISAIQALTVTEAVEAGVGAVNKAVSTSKHWIEAIAAVASLGAVVAAAIATAKSQKSGFANGGIVGGNSFTGDRVTANVNSGEMILNKSQQARLFRMANGGTGGQVEFHISGTDLVGVLDNNNRKNRLIR